MGASSVSLLVGVSYRPTRSENICFGFGGPNGAELRPFAGRSYYWGGVSLLRAAATPS